MAPPMQLATMMPSLRSALAMAAVLAGVLATVSLGNWQLRRAAEKIAREHSWTAAQRGAPVDLGYADDLAAVAQRVPQHVRLRGTFDHEHTIWLDNRPLDGRPGFLVVTPLRLKETPERVLVDRGWAPRDPLDRTRLPPIGRPAGEVVIEGLALAGVPRVFQFTRADAGRIRQNLDFDEIAAEIGAPVARFVVQQSSSTDDALDRHWPPPSTGADRNRGYAVQWFALATLLGVILIGLLWRTLRPRTGAAGTT
jgi:surfeit locus 1 family protein